MDKATGTLLRLSTKIASAYLSGPVTCEVPPDELVRLVSRGLILAGALDPEGLEPTPHSVSVWLEAAAAAAAAEQAEATAAQALSEEITSQAA